MVFSSVFEDEALLHDGILRDLDSRNYASHFEKVSDLHTPSFMVVRATRHTQGCHLLRFFGNAPIFDGLSDKPTDLKSLLKCSEIASLRLTNSKNCSFYGALPP